MKKALPPSFFDRPTLTVAQELLGKFLVMKNEQGSEEAFMITEVEAYDGPLDRASHAFHGKTLRTEVMFGPAGYWYVYLIYGMYWMLNIVTGPKDYPAAILIRGVSDIMGPGKLTKTLNIDKRFNNQRAHKQTHLWIEEHAPSIHFVIKKTPRIGVQYAGPVWSKKRYRFVLQERSKK